MAVFVCYVVAVVAILLVVPVLVRACFGSQEAVADEEASDVAPGEVPKNSDIIMGVGIELGRMTAGVATLLLVTFFFAVRREMTSFNLTILTGFPILLVIVHMCIVLDEMQKVLLYYAGLDRKIHICFTPQKPMYLSPIWILLLLALIAYVVAVLHTLLSDSSLYRCDVHDGVEVDCVALSSATIIALVAVKAWALLFPACYCLALIFQDEQFQKRLVPLYAIVAQGDSLDDAEKAPRFLGSLKPIKEADFLKAGDEIYKTGGIEAISFAAVADKCVSGGSDAQRSCMESLGSCISTSYWTWKVRLERTESRVRGLYHLAIVVVSAIAFMTIFILTALLYSNTLIPTLDSVTPTVGQMSPAFDPYVFDYVMFLDQRVKGCAFEILSNKDLVATTELKIPDVNSNAVEAWANATHTSYIPMLAKPPKIEPSDRDGNGIIEEGEGQSKMLKASKQMPVTIEFVARGAGTSMKYRITVIKLEPRVTALEYKYNTSSRVDEVTVFKQIDWEKVSPAEDTESEDDAMANAEGEGVAIYVPEDTESVFIDLHRELQIFGPAQAVVRGGDMNWFDAVRSVKLCHPGEDCGNSTNNSKSNSSHPSTQKDVKLDDDLTAVPVELKPNGSDPFKFEVSIVKVSNRLIDLGFQMARDGADSVGWQKSPPLPAFRPFTNNYEAFFEVPGTEKSPISAVPSPAPMSAFQLQTSGSSAEDQQTTTSVFFRIEPQGDARVNWIKAEVLPDKEGQRLEPFCRPPADEDQPLDPSISQKTNDLACGATADTAEHAEEGESTEKLMIQADGRNFSGHFFVKYTFAKGEALPFTVQLRVMFHDENPALVRGHNFSNTSNISDVSNHKYMIHFLPQQAMRLDLRLPVTGPPSSAFVVGAPSSAPPPSPSPASGALIETTSRLQKRNTSSFLLPVFLDRPYRSDVFEYSAALPQGIIGTLDMMLGQFHSFWAGIRGDNAPLEGPGWGSAVKQHFALHRTCDADGHVVDGAPAPAPSVPTVSFASVAVAPAPATVEPASPAPSPAAFLCPLSVVAYERKDGFPHTYVVKLREALDDEILFIGSLLPDGTAKEILGFRPTTHEFVAPTLGLVWNWQLPAANSPAAAPVAAQEALNESLITVRMAAAPAPAGATASLSMTASLFLLLSQPLGALSEHLEAFWNDGILPVSHSGVGAWRSVYLQGSVIAEICWCERTQPGPSCHKDLKRYAPEMADLGRPNRCTLEFRSGNRTLYKIEVGEGSTNRVTQEDMAEAAQQAEMQSAEQFDKSVAASPSPAMQPAQPPATPKNIVLLQGQQDFVEPPWDFFRHDQKPLALGIGVRKTSRSKREAFALHRSSI
jgi:hypothetical protein